MDVGRVKPLLPKTSFCYQTAQEYKLYLITSTPISPMNTGGKFLKRFW